ncbi:MAG: S24 family peptidase [Gammaproteobacteria bacterium]|nr:S24 family peptidase [Gammaproteobacteria bacterium]NNJ71725.1 S24 family peptidase [Enterobacterales bacterium]
MTVHKQAPESSCSEKEPYALQVLGNDMEPEFPDKCIIVIEQSTNKVTDAYVVAEVEGSRWFRQYCQDENGREYLKACNSLYPDIELVGVDWSIQGIIRQKNIGRKITKYS